MNGEKPGEPLAFTPADHLQLLQLQTLRAIAERQRRPARADDQAESDESAGESEAPQAPIPAKWRLVPPDTQLYDWQRECLPLWLKEGRGTVKVATGGGKTLFALAAAQQLQNEREPDLRLAIVVPTIPLMFQWRDEVARGNLPERAIGLMGGGQELPPVHDLRVLICVLASARERLPELIQKAGWAPRLLLVVDECHRANAKQSQRIFDAAPRYALGLSATPEQALESEELPSDEAYESGPVGRALGRVIYTFSIRDSLAANLLTPFEVWHIGLPMTPAESAEHAQLSREIAELRKDLQVRHRKSRSKLGFLGWCQSLASRQEPDATRFIGLANSRKRLLYRARARIEVTLGVLTESSADPDRRAIVFHESIEEIESLFGQARTRGLPVVLEHSQLPDGLRAENIDAFRRGIARTIISAKSLVEGFNVPSADLGIIAASSGSVRQRIQSLGRMLRRKPGGRTARIIVLYVRDTEDESIYEKADWEAVIGAERNRYFAWSPPEESRGWQTGLEETATPPRVYRPSCWEIDVETLRFGDPYPGQSHGLDLKLDQAGNLRADDGALVPNVSPRCLEYIAEKSPYRRARRTPAGHLIVRIDPQGAAEQDWRYLGQIEAPAEAPAVAPVRLLLQRTGGRREIARPRAGARGTVDYALPPGKSRTPEAGQARDELLAWVRRVETERQCEVRELFWNSGSGYWVEVGGERIPHPGPLAPLEFAE